MERCYTRFWLIFSLLILLVIPVAWGESTDLCDLRFKNADIRDVLRALADQSGANLVLDNSVNGTVTIHLTKVTFIDALNVITKTYNLTYTKENKIYRISQIDNSVLKVEFTEGLLTVEAKDVKLRQLFETISQKTGANLVPAPDVQDQINISFYKTPLADGIATILTQTNCIEEKINSVSYIKKRGPQPPLSVKFHDNLLSVDVDGVEVAVVMNEVTRQSGANIVLDRDVRGGITAHFKDLPLAQALSAMLESQGWAVDRQRGYYNVTVNTVSRTNLKINYDAETQLFDLDVQSSPISQIITEMARKANLNIVIMPQVSWNINNVRLQKLKFPQVLDFLLKGTVFTYRMIDTTCLVGDGLFARPETSDFVDVKVYSIKYLKADQLLNTLPPVFPRQNFMQLPDKNALIVSAPTSIHNLFTQYLNQVDIASIEDRTEVIRIKYLKAEDVLKLIPSSIPKGDLMVVKETNSITVTGPQNLIGQVRQYVEKVDQINPMIVFDVLVVSISNSNGINWNPSYGAIAVGDNKEVALSLNPKDPTFVIKQKSPLLPPPTPVPPGVSAGTPTMAPVNMLATLNLLIQKGQAKVISNPTITTLNGYQTSFKVTSKRNYPITSSTSTDPATSTTTSTQTVKTFDSGLTISITPWVSANNQITMEIKPSISEFGDNPNSTLPSTFERSTETNIRVSDRQTVVISGLKTTRKEKMTVKIPILGDIPLLGSLFKTTSDNESQDEFVIVITPYLVYDEAMRTEASNKIMNRIDPALSKEVKSNVLQLSTPTPRETGNPNLKNNPEIDTSTDTPNPVETPDAAQTPPPVVTKPTPTPTPGQTPKPN
jgi:general secretion pathway protein D